MASKILVSLDLFRDILGLAHSVKFVDVEMAQPGVMSVTVDGIGFAAGAELRGISYLHECEGKRWHRTELEVPSYRK